MESVKTVGKGYFEKIEKTRLPSSAAVFLVGVLLQSACAGEPRAVRFREGPGQIEILVGEQPFARYVYEDERIPRPYFCDIHTPDGVRVSRNHPPIEGVDATDHSTYHPGMWLAFGDISGADFWRLEARVEHVGMVEETKGGPGWGSFAVENAYRSGDETICREVCRYRLETLSAEELGDDVSSGYLFFHDSEFFNDEQDFVFGDQEEMGLGVRVATPISGDKDGVLSNSLGGKAEEGTWGKIADWCDYSGPKEGKRIGFTLIPHPDNFRKCWFHSRDYGLLLANPFGRAAYTDGPPSAVVVKKGERFALRYGVFIYSTDLGNEGLPEKGYEAYLGRVKG